LRLEELVDAIAVEPDASLSFDPNNRMPEPRDTLRICSSLVVFTHRPYRFDEVKYSSSNGETVRSQMDAAELRLAHFSVKEYLMSKRVTSCLTLNLVESSARSSIATLCLTYLSDLNHRLWPNDVIAQFAFSEYCAKYWTSHAKVVEEVDTSLQARIMESLDNRENTYLTCYNIHDPDPPWSVGGMEGGVMRVTDKPTSLYYVSLTGLGTSAGALLDKGADVNAQSGYYGHALQAASYEGHQKITQMLLDRGAHVNAQGGYYGKALQAVSEPGHDWIVQTLLDRDEAVYAQGRHFGSALHTAFAHGRDKIV
jgi:hypothetical protein